MFRNWITACLVLLETVLVSEPAFGQASLVKPVAPGQKHALLVGCSHYEHQAGAELKGPPNDVREMANALTTRFGFETAAVRQLVGWPDDPAQRPTRENIMRAFLELERSVKPDSHVVIYLSGHGIRVPIPAHQKDPLDPKNPELDGYDEAFVAADAQYTGSEFKNLIQDDEIGRMLDTLRAKGAHVWAIFDCCHSGTMTRGVNDEQSRELMAKDFGVPKEEIDRADAQAARGAPPVSRGYESGVTDGLVDSAPTEKSPGTVVAFYAAQPFETAPDLRCPLQAPDRPENYFGLMTYTTLQTLLQQRDSSRVTYRELGQLVINRYRAERGSRGPTPTFSGDLDHEVLGFQHWPGRSRMTLRMESGKWLVNAGELQGLTVGSVLSVGTPSKSGPLGYLQVAQSGSTSAEVQPCEYNNHPAIDIDQLKELMPCQVEQRHLGELRLRLAVATSDQELKPSEKAARLAVSQLSELTREFVETFDSQQSDRADWQLVSVTPQIARSSFGFKITGPRIVLTRTGEPALGSSPASAGNAGVSQVPQPARAYQVYDPQDAASFRAALEADLLKICTWQNLWRLSGRMAGNLADPRCDVQVELATLSDPNDQSASQPLTRPGVPNGQLMELRVKNNGTDRLWVTLVFLNSNFLIDVLPTQQLNLPGSDGDALQPIRFKVKSQQAGAQGWLVIASSAESDRHEPDFSFLAQGGLGKAPREVAVPQRASASPFESLTRAIAGQRGAFRGAALSPGANPTLVIRSWQVERASSSMP